MTDRPKSDKKQIALAWNELVRNLRRMEETSLELLRHPDATAEEIMLVAERYRDAFARLHDNEPAVINAVANSYPLMKTRNPR